MKEFLRGSVEERPAGSFFPTDFLNEAPLQKTAHAVVTLHASDGVNFGLSNWLLVRYNCEHFEKTSTQPLPMWLEKTSDRFGIFGLGAKLISTGDLDELQRTASLQTGAKDLQRLFHLAFGGFERRS